MILWIIIANIIIIKFLSMIDKKGIIIMALAFSLLGWYVLPGIVTGMIMGYGKK